ncbi:MAG: cytochrome c [Chloroflexi bacterium]|nr:cytochrome c [Chloroflexota bacterium]MCL5275079.1 cytochrome c [Chloroflexota bacterium]
MRDRSKMMVAALISGFLLLAACGSSAPAPTPTQSGPKVSTDAQKFASLKGDPVNGKTKYETTCIACHGPDLKGMPNLGKNLTTSTFLKGLPDAEAVLFLTKGRPSSDPLNTTKVDMPPRGGNPALKDQDLADIIAYVRTMQK